MKKIITLLLIIIPFLLFSQDEITYEKTLYEIEHSQRRLCIDLLVPNDDFSIGIYTKNVIVEDLTKEQCGDIKTDSLKNSKILEVLKTEKLLDSFYILFDDKGYDEYVKINSSETFEWNKAKLIIILNPMSIEFGLDQIFIPIHDKKQAKELIESISKIFNSDYCFKKLKRKV